MLLLMNIYDQDNKVQKLITISVPSYFHDGVEMEVSIQTKVNNVMTAIWSMVMGVAMSVLLK